MIKMSVEELNIQVSPGITIHGEQSGTGPPLLLLHSFPQTHHIWHKITSKLASDFTVIAIDLRGYGKSSKPPSTAKDSHKMYAKSTMALDCISVMSSRRFEKFSIISHDRGARVAHKLCVNHPEKVEKVMLLDIAPTLAMFEKTRQRFATAYWHWFFLIQPSPFPETLILDNPKTFEDKFFAGCDTFMDDNVLREYVEQLKDKSCVHAMCEDYRAAATIDLMEARKDKEEGKKIECPVKVLWGKHGVIEKCFNCLEEWKDVCDNVCGEAVDSGHYIAEEVPDELLKHVWEFF